MDALRQSAAERVARGAAWLDAVVGPEWDGRVNTRSIDIASSALCICGQVFGSYHQAPWPAGIDQSEMAHTCGFAVAKSLTQVETPVTVAATMEDASRLAEQVFALNREWVALIEARRKARTEALAVRQEFATLVEQETLAERLREMALV